MARTRITNRNTQGVVTLPLPYGNLLAPGGGVVVTDDAATVITNLGGPAVVVACGLGVDALASAESATPSPPQDDPVLGGDLSGTASAATVLKLNGNNLNSAGARSALGLGSAATQNTSAFDASGAATAAQAASAQKSANLSDLANAGTARTNLGLGSSATHAASDFAGAGVNTSSVAPGVTDAGHGHSFTGTTDYRPFERRWPAPALEGTVVVSAFAKNDATPKALDGAQLECCRAVALKLGVGWASTDAVVVGVRGRVGLAVTYTSSITIPANSSPGDVIEFDTAGSNPGFQPYLAFIEITSVDAPAGWTAGAFEVVTSKRLGVNMPYEHWGTITPIWEFAGAAGAPMAGAAPGSVYNGAGGGPGQCACYQPSATLDGAKDVILHFSVQEALAGAVGSNTTGLTVNTHVHAQT